MHSHQLKMIRNPQVPQGHFKCHSCNVCRFSMMLKEFTSPDGSRFKLKDCITCSTKFSIYCIICACKNGTQACETKTRITEHKSKIQKRDLQVPIVSHFLEAGHICDYIQFFIIETMKPHPFQNLIANTFYFNGNCFWIFTLGTVTRGGGV